MAHRTSREVTIIVDEDNDLITIAVGDCHCTMTRGEWSKIVATPRKLPRELR